MTLSFAGARAHLRSMRISGAMHQRLQSLNSCFVLGEQRGVSQALNSCFG